jgi:esterase/lipase superfamily enzyme
MRTISRRVTSITALILALAACSQRGEIVVAPEAAQIGETETVIVASSRQKMAGPPFFTEVRADRTSFAAFQVSVPPDRELGVVKFPRGRLVNFREDFVVVAEQSLPDERAFIRKIDDVLADQTDRQSFLFIHGYNTNFAEGLYRQAQLQHDLQRRGASIQFAWPSAAGLLDYGHDRESALFARDSLEETIRALAKSNASGFNLVGHSMGTFLLMDTLRTMSLGRDPRVFEKMNAVVLLSADIDVDVFRKQAAPVLAMGIPIYVIVSQSDRALKLSALIRGDQNRLGNITSQAELDGLDVTVIDLSEIKSADATGHFKAGTSPALINFVQALGATGLEVFSAGTRPGLVETSVAVIQSGTRILVAPLSP